MVLMVAAQFLFLVRLEDWWDAAAYGCVVASYSLWIGYFSYIYFYKAVDPSKKSQTALRGWACGLLFTLGVLGLVQRAEPAVKRVGLSSFGLAASLLFVTAALAPVPPTPVFTTPWWGLVGSLHLLSGSLCTAAASNGDERSHAVVTAIGITCICVGVFAPPAKPKSL